MKDNYLKKELYELIKTDESIFDFIQESSLDGLWYWDLENPAEEWMNPKFWTVLGYNPEEMPHKSTAWQNIINSDDLKVATENFTRHCENPDHPYDQTVRYTHKNGSTVWIRCRGLAIRDKTGKAVRMLGAHNDITDIKQSEQDIKLKNEELLLINSEKDKFFSILAHDLRSPYNTIIGFSEILQSQTKEKNYEGIEQYAGIIQQASQRAVALLNNLMEWAQSQTGRMEYNPEYFDMNTILNEVILLMKDSAEQKHITLTNKILPEIQVYADTAMLGTVTRNLISNAIKFTHPNGKITVTSVVNQNELIISVIDTGVGISKERIDKLFKIGEGHSTTGTAKEQGTGLGLILCKEFIEKHGGRIWVESEQGIGSTIYFTLPYHADSVKETVVQEFATSDKSDQIRKLKILIAEDDHVSEMLFDRTVKIFSREILYVRTGVEAVEACRNNLDIDLVLMDIRMPEMDGYEATRQIREFNKDVIIIAQTAYGMTGERKKATDADCNDYIAKPIKKEELMGLIHKYFGECNSRYMAIT